MRSRWTFVATFLLVVSIFAGISINANADYHPQDRNTDDVVTYDELTDSQRRNMLDGYSANLRGGGLGYEMYYVMEQKPYIKEIGLPNSRGKLKTSYGVVSTRVKRYYLNLRTDEKIYPRHTRQWYVTDTWEDKELGWVASVDCTYPHQKLTTPETIHEGGKKYKVVALDLHNAYVKELTVTDNITTIIACQTPMLKDFKGGFNVEKIGDRAFKDNIYMVNLPYFPYLTSIGNYAFIGCVNLKDVLLPPLIENLGWNAFGWYDCVKGNYDFEHCNREDFEYNDIDELAGCYRIEGITLYATKKTTTWDTLEDLLGEGRANSLGDLAYAPKENYPGRAAAIIIDDEEPYADWLPPLEDPSKMDWGESSVADPEDPKSIMNSVTYAEKTTIKYLTKLFLSDNIDEDMYLTLIGATVGANDIPPEFAHEHALDTEFPTFLDLYRRNRTQYVNEQTLREKKRIDEAMELSKALTQHANNMLYYIVNDISIAGETGIYDKLGIKNKMKVFEVVDHLNRMSIYIDSGDSYGEAGLKTLTTATYLTWASEAAPTALKIYETVIYALFGNSKAADAASIVTMGRHFVELTTDLVVGTAYDSFYEASMNFAEDVRWDAFCMLLKLNTKLVLKRLIDENYSSYGAYGETITNIAYIARVCIDGPMWEEIKKGFDEMYHNGTLLNTYIDVVYDTTVKNNKFGEILSDFVASFYEDGSKPIFDDYIQYLIDKVGEVWRAKPDGK